MNTISDMDTLSENITQPKHTERSVLLPSKLSVEDLKTQDPKGQSPSNYPLEIKLYKRRWLFLLIFSLSAMMTSVYQLSFASIQGETLTYFNMEHSEWNKKKVNLFSLVYNVTIIYAFLASYFIKRLGLAPMVDLGMILHFVGGWVRFGASFFRNEIGFWACFAGQAIASIAQPTISYSGTLFSSNWFGAHERTLATTISSFMNLFGSGVAFALNTMVGKGREWAIMIPLLIHALIATVIAIVGLPIFRSNPPTPANIASSNDQLKKISFLTDIYMLFTNINAIVLLITFGLGFGSVCSFLTLISQIVSPKNYDGTTASIFGLLIIFSGGFGAVIFSYLAAKTKRFRLLMWSSGVGSALALAGFTFVIRYEKNLLFTILLCLFSSILGGFALPMVPITMELACEITYPVAANISHATFGSAGTLGNIIFVLVLQELRNDKGSMQNAMYVILGGLVLSLVVLIFFRGKNRRMIHEAKIREQKTEEDDEIDVEYYRYPKSTRSL